MTIVVVGTLILAFVYDSSGTARLLATTLSIRGVTWITKKVTEELNRDASQIIDFTGWSIAGISIVGILSNAIASVDKVTELIDRITFWN